MTRAAICVAAIAWLSGCFASHGRGGAGAPERGDAGAGLTRDGGAPVDAGGGRPDAGAGGLDAGRSGRCRGTERFYERGYCFEARRCCAAADCGAGAWRCSNQRCEPLGRPCGCVSDADCASGGACLTNEVVCGVCFPERPRCGGPADCGGGICREGWCEADECVVARAP